MYNANGIYYTEEHSVSFGELDIVSSGGSKYIVFRRDINTWDTWHLIPSIKPAIAHPTFVSQYVEKTGRTGNLDLTQYFNNQVYYGMRKGVLSFILDSHQENLETIQQEMIENLHGQRVFMLLEDDPSYYYEGIVNIGEVSYTDNCPVISIAYQLDPFKYKVTPEGSAPVIWDTFNFETDYDYSVIGESITVSGTPKSYSIYSSGYQFEVFAEWISGTVTVTFGDESHVMSSTDTISLGRATSDENILTVSGNGSVKIEWRGGSL